MKSNIQSFLLWYSHTACKAVQDLFDRHASGNSGHYRPNTASLAASMSGPYHVSSEAV